MFDLFWGISKTPDRTGRQLTAGQKPYVPRFAPRAPSRSRLGAGRALPEAFTSSVKIPHFEAGSLPPAKPLASYNDGVVLEHYTSAARTYLGAQRRGVIGDRAGASWEKEPAMEALSAKFPMARKIPLPSPRRKPLAFCKNDVLAK